MDLLIHMADQVSGAGSGPQLLIEWGLIWVSELGPDQVLRAKVQDNDDFTIQRPDG